MLVDGGEQFVRSEDVGHFEGADRVHVRGHDWHSVVGLFRVAELVSELNYLLVRHEFLTL